jgi:hypothetical protein
MRRPPNRPFEQTVLFLQMLDHVQLMAVDPTGEHHQQEVKRWEQ